MTRLYEFSQIVVDFVAGSRHQQVMTGQYELSWTPPSANSSAPFTRAPSTTSLGIDNFMGGNAPDYTFDDATLWDADSPEFKAMFDNPGMNSMGAAWEDQNLSLLTKN